MKLHFDNDWLRQKIATDPDFEPSAGAPRYEVSAYSEATNRREVIDYRDTAEEAVALANTIDPGRWPWVTDMNPQNIASTSEPKP